MEPPSVDELYFLGLRHIAPAAVAAKIRSCSGDRFDAAKIEGDIRILARLGWFESIRVDTTPAPAPLSPWSENSNRVTLVFHLREFPLLSKVEYSGSGLLPQKQIEKMLEDKKLALGPGKPADPAALHRIALAIRSGLSELSHPESNVQIISEESKNATVNVRFEINDGPLLRVRRVTFDGHPQVSTKLLRTQVRIIAPWKPLASWRGANAYTREGFEEDRQRILTYYQNHGFPEARIANALFAQSDQPLRRWLLWPHQSAQKGLTVAIPVEAGSFYQFESILATDALHQAADARSPAPANLRELGDR